jgi:pyruvate/2-oxoglutarate dehydrogenase complex dihydrolipoamide dehydrogenase (E3) component
VTVLLSPGDSDAAAEARLLDRVHPENWRNPEPKPVYDLAILGAGPAGLAAAAEAIDRGLSVALIERARLGGNSLNAGSIPSKTIVASARIFGTAHHARELGAPSIVQPDGVSSAIQEQTDFGNAMRRMRRVRARIAEYHSVERLCAAGIDIFFGDARFAGSNTLAAGDARLTFRKALIATGARPRPSDIPGLEETGYWTSETIFAMSTLPRRLAVIGGGPLGCEAAQAFSRLGSHTILIQNDPKFLPREERDAAETLSMSLTRDGVETRLNTTVTRARLEGGKKILETANNGIEYSFDVDEILLSIGRLPNVETLRLEAACIEVNSTNCIQIDEFLRTANPDVYAAGDVAMEHKFTNVAEATGRMAVRNAFGKRKQRRSHLMIPWCTYTDPEIAHIGMHIWQARELAIPVRSITIMMQDTDRAIVDGQDIGFVKIHLRDGTDRILGATIVASRASEMINEMSVVLSAGLGMRELANVMHTYPAQSEAIRQAALVYVRDRDRRA